MNKNLHNGCWLLNKVLGHEGCGVSYRCPNDKGNKQEGVDHPMNIQTMFGVFWSLWQVKICFGCSGRGVIVTNCGKFFRLLEKHIHPPHGHHQNLYHPNLGLQSEFCFVLFSNSHLIPNFGICSFIGLKSLPMPFCVIWWLLAYHEVSHVNPSRVVQNPLSQCTYEVDTLMRPHQLPLSHKGNWCEHVDVITSYKHCVCSVIIIEFLMANLISTNEGVFKPNQFTPSTLIVHLPGLWNAF